MEMQTEKKTDRNLAVIVLLLIIIAFGPSLKDDNAEEVRVTERETQIGYLMEVAKETSDPVTRTQVQSLVRDLESQR